MEESEKPIGTVSNRQSHVSTCVRSDQYQTHAFIPPLQRKKRKLEIFTWIKHLYENFAQLTMQILFLWKKPKDSCGKLQLAEFIRFEQKIKNALNTISFCLFFYHLHLKGSELKNYKM